MSFALKLKELREKKGLSQAQLAKELNVGIGSVGMWESTQRTPPARRLICIANYFNVSIDYLLKDDDSEVYLSDPLPSFPPMFSFMLKELRQEKDLTQAELAEILDYTEDKIIKWENRTAEPNITELSALAEFFDVSTEYLVSGVKSAASTSEGGATEQERELLRLFRELSPYLKGMTLNAVRSWAKNEGDSERKKV